RGEDRREDQPIRVRLRDDDEGSLRSDAAQRRRIRRSLPGAPGGQGAEIPLRRRRNTARGRRPGRSHSRDAGDRPGETDAPLPQTEGALSRRDPGGKPFTGGGPPKPVASEVTARHSIVIDPDTM